MTQTTKSSLSLVEEQLEQSKEVELSDHFNDTTSTKSSLSLAEEQLEQSSNDSSSCVVESTRQGGDSKLFYYDEIIHGRRLGQGTFADVFEVRQFKPLAENDGNFGEACLKARRYYEESSGVDSTGKTKYAVKCLKEHFDSPKKFRLAAKDIEREAKILAAIDHQNIIKVYATSASGAKASNCTKEQTRDFFIVVDRLSTTLTAKIAHWTQEKRRLAIKPVFKRHDRAEGNKKTKFLTERFRAAYGVACALAYLHEKHIVYRDLKADNVGFDMSGQVKVFDFGLARTIPKDPELKRHDGKRNDTYIMSGTTGSLPFMAPEVWRNLPYNEKADVHSFGVLLWQIFSLELPYIDLIYDMDDLTKRVMLKGERPPIKPKWPKEIRDLLPKAWAKDMAERPTMEQVCTILKELVGGSAAPTAGPTLPKGSGRNANANPPMRSIPPIVVKRSSHFW